MTPIHAPQPHVPQNPCVYKHFVCEEEEEHVVMEKMAAAGMGNKKILALILR